MMSKFASDRSIREYCEMIWVVSAIANTQKYRKTGTTKSSAVKVKKRPILASSVGCRDGNNTV